MSTEPGQSQLLMWTNESRGRYDRSKLRYPSDLTDEEWALVVPLIPPAKPCGNKRTVDVREVVNGLMYILSTGCQWAAIPKDLAPRSTVHDYLDRWEYDGTLERIHHALYVQCRTLAGRDASPSVAIIDSQSVKSTEKGGPGPAEALDRRADHRLAEPMPSIGQGLGVPEPQGARVPASRLDPAHAAKAMSKPKNDLG